MFFFLSYVKENIRIRSLRGNIWKLHKSSYLVKKMVNEEGLEVSSVKVTEITPPLHDKILFKPEHM